MASSLTSRCIASSSRQTLTPSIATRCTTTLPPRSQRRSRPNARFSSSSTAAAPTDLITELQSRGLVQTLTSRALSSHLASAPRVVYSGVDPSADSLHVGNLLPLLTLAHFARFDHTPIVLVGGATGSIGDPSGRSSERNALDETTLQRNVEGITTQLRVFFDNVAAFYREQGESIQSATGSEEGGVELGMGVKLMNNYTWMSGISLLTFLGEVGRHARLTQMLARDSVASRLTTTGLSYTEFSYQLLQAYDFSFLHSKHGCTIQVGGSDQLGNITAGIDLIRRTHSSSLAEDPAYGLTLPLLTTHTGEKFGKSAGNAVWLSARKTSDLDFYQFFLRSGDDDVGKYLRCLTLLSPQEVDGVMKEHEADRKARSAQRKLADHMTRLIRGKGAMDKCRVLTRVLFSHSTQYGGVRDGESAAKEALAELEVEHITQQDNVLTRLEMDQVVGADVTRLVVSAGLVRSRGEAKRLLSSGGLYVNNRQVGLGGEVVEGDLVEVKGGEGRVCLLRAGKSAVRVVFVK